jgi:hypothetical protein
MNDWWGHGLEIPPMIRTVHICSVIVHCRVRHCTIGAAAVAQTETSLKYGTITHTQFCCTVFFALSISDLAFALLQLLSILHTLEGYS